MNRLTIRKRILPDESLSSYIMRCAEANGIEFMELFNLFKLNKYRLHTGDIHRIDFFPNSVIDTERLCKLTNTSITMIRNATLANVLNIFKGDSSEINCRFLRDSIKDYLSYCPKCFEENKKMKLIWKIRDVKVCLLHNGILLDLCHYCLKKIKYKHIVEIGRCPYCENDLGKNISTINNQMDLELVHEQYWLIHTWGKLLYNSEHKIMDHTELAVRLLYVINQMNPSFNKDIIRRSIKESSIIHILQIARGTSKKRSLHINTIMSTLYCKSLDIDEFLSMSIPISFTESIQSRKLKPFKMQCIAPWCTNFGFSRGILKTASKNVSKGEKFFKEYFVCMDCGCEYGIDKNSVIHERTFFNKGYSILRNQNISKLTWHEREKIFGLKRNRIMRILAYFNTRGHILGGEQQLNLDFEKVNLFCNAIEQGVPLDDVQKWKIWKNEMEYLMNRFHPLVIRCMFEYYYHQKTISDLDNNFTADVKVLCKLMISNGTRITLPSVAKELRCSVTTLHNHGCSIVVSRYKKIQKKSRIQDLKMRVQEQAKLYFNNNLGYIHSIPLFESLEVSRSILKKYAPEMCEHIDRMRLDRNESLKNIGR